MERQRRKHVTVTRDGPVLLPSVLVEASQNPEAYHASLKPRCSTKASTDLIKSTVKVRPGVPDRPARPRRQAYPDKDMPAPDDPAPGVVTKAAGQSKATINARASALSEAKANGGCEVKSPGQALVKVNGKGRTNARDTTTPAPAKEECTGGAGRGRGPVPNGSHRSNGSIDTDSKTTGSPGAGANPSPTPALGSAGAEGREGGEVRERRQRRERQPAWRPPSSRERSPEPEPGIFLGVEVFKRFGRDGIFKGKVSSFYAKEGYYSIKYEDGDAEDLDCGELQELMRGMEKQGLEKKYLAKKK